MNWVFWLILVIILSIVEIITVGLVSIWFVISGIVVMLLSFVISDSAILGTIFILLGIILLVLSRPIVKRISKGNNEATNLDRIIGSTGVVTEDILKNSIGEVHVDGKRWSAISKEKCLKGDLVKVLKIDGVKLVVEKESD